MTENEPRPEADEGISEGTTSEDQDDVSSEGGEGSDSAAATPELDEGGEADQTQSPAVDDVGVPEDSGADKS